MIACVTGHRPNKLGGYNENNPTAIDVKQRLKNSIEYLLNIGYDTFISGMAIGVDMWFAEIILELKSDLPHIKLICAIPFVGQETMWNKTTQQRYFSILNRADETVIVSNGGYSAYKMQLRNEWMINHSTAVVGVWNGSTGGTGNCIRYIRTKNHVQKFIRIDPSK